MNTASYSLAKVLILFFLVTPAQTQGALISVGFATPLPMPIGQTDTVAVTVKNIGNSTVQLTFVGLRFDWDAQSSFFIGQNSDKGAVLAAGEQITYSIAVTVPDITPGTHRLNALVSYRVLERGNWTGVVSVWWVADMPLAPSQTQQTSTKPSTGSGILQSFNQETIAILVLVAAIGLFLERGRIRRSIAKYRKVKPGPSEPEAKKPAKVEKKEEDL